MFPQLYMARNPGQIIVSEASTPGGFLFHEALAPMVVQAGKTYNVLSTSWGLKPVV